MIDSIKFPIVVIGTAPRCGSTPYVHLLKQKTKLPCFHEPWAIRLLEPPNEYNETAFIQNPLMQKEKFIEYMKIKSTSNRYIVKFFFDDIEHRSPYHEELSTGYKIGLFRRNIVDQIASYYIAEGRRKFHDIKGEEQKNYTINIDCVSLSVITKIITKANFYLQNCQILDKKIHYEDIDFSDLKSSQQKTLQPLNIEDLKLAIQQIMNEKIPCHWTNGIGAHIDRNKIKITYV